VRVELDKSDRPKPLVNRAQDRQEDRMIAAHASCAGVRLQHVIKLRGNSLEGVFDGKRVNGQIAIICDSGLFERIDIQRRIPGPDDCRLLPHAARSESRTRTISGPTVVRYADQGDVEFVGS
jgi:hypothetical protein